MLDRRAMLGAAGVLAFPAQAYSLPPGKRVMSAMMFDDPATLCYPLFNTRLSQEICGNINESLLLFDWQFKPQPNHPQLMWVNAPIAIPRPNLTAEEPNEELKNDPSAPSSENPG